MKKLLSFILVLALAISCVSMMTFTASAATYGDLTYEISNGEVTITGCNTSPIGALTIPATIEGYPVTRIGDEAFVYCDKLTSITIPDGVTSIGSSAFSWCSSLTSITIGNGVTSIGDDAFLNCSSLTSITIPNSVTSIGSYAFYGCSSLTSVTIGNSVTSIGSGAFYYCSGLTSITIPDSVTSIGTNPFAVCTKIESITVDENNSSYYSKDNCLIEKATNKLISGCKNSIIPDSVTSIGDSAFEYCSSLTSIIIPDGVTSIGNYAFGDCSSLISITIPDSVTSIGDGAFCNCSSLTSIIIPYDATSIGAWAFMGCSNLTSVTIPGGVKSIYPESFWGCSSLTSITIPDGVTYIHEGAFYNCSNLTSITIPDSVTDIGWQAFEYCSSLKTVYYNGTDEQWNNIEIDLYNDSLKNAKREKLITYFEYEINVNQVTITGFDTSKGGEIEIPATIEGYPVTAIGNFAFEECTLITKLVLPESIKTIGAWAFTDCSSLTKINIPKGVTKINSYTFYNCTALEEVYYSGTKAEWASITIASNNAPLNNATVYCNYMGGESITKYLSYKITDNQVTITDCDTSVAGIYFIPDTIEGYPVTSIGSSAFYGCNKLTSITIPDSVTSIGDDAFYNCSNLISITIPDSVTSIGSRAFYYCSSLTSITIPDSVKSIGHYAFQYCSSLTSIIIPDSVTSIGANPFNVCTKIESITVDENNSAYYSKDNCLIEKATNKLISGCKNSIIPDGVTSIGYYAFSWCSSFTSITIPDSVTSIGSNAFHSCSSLTSITIPNSVTSIGNSAFYNCSNLQTVYYSGTKSQWDKITIGSSNEDLTNADVVLLSVNITGATVDVGASLTINYFVQFDNLDKFGLTTDDFEMRFISATGKVDLVKGVYDAETGYYKFAYTGINPQCMNDNIKAEVVFGEEVCAVKESYSIYEYCSRQIYKTATQLGLTELQHGKLQTLLADMLVYGSASQEYKNYNAENLPDIDEWVQNYKSNFTVPNGVRKITGNADINNKATSVGLNMANVNRIYFKLKLTDDVVVKLNGVEVDKSTMVKNSDGTYTLYSKDIKATQFDDVFTLTIIKDGVEITKVEYNVNAYIQGKYTNADLAKIVKALSNYGKSATAYIDALKNVNTDNNFNLEEDVL